MKFTTSRIIIFLFFITIPIAQATAQTPVSNASTMGNDISPLIANGTIFDDTLLLEGFTQRYRNESQDTLFAMIQDETLDDMKIAAAVRAFRLEYALKIFSREKEQAEITLIRQLNRSDSPFVSVEIMHTLCLIDRYKYFHIFVPQLIQKLDHYNETINGSAYAAINEIIEKGNNRSREARIVFNTLRKILFLSRRRLAQIKTPDTRLAQKLKILKWSIKVLGSQEIKRLPKEAINLL